MSTPKRTPRYTKKRWSREAPLRKYTACARSLRMMALPTWLLGRVLGRPRWRDTLGTLLIRRKK